MDNFVRFGSEIINLDRVTRVAQFDEGKATAVYFDYQHPIPDPESPHFTGSHNPTVIVFNDKEASRVWEYFCARASLKDEFVGI